MRKVFLSMALVALLACPALADQTFDLGTFALGAGESVGGSFDKNDNGTVESITISYDYSEAVQDGSWASDARFTLLGPGGQSLDIGGFDNPVNNPGPWSFDGAGSDLDGFYSTTFDVGGSKGGTWDWTFTNDWGADANANLYANIQVTITNVAGPAVPEPAAATLLALGTVGLVARRRRR